jgi:hypothetical protein
MSSPCLEAAREALHRDLKETLRLLRIARQNSDKPGTEVHEDRLNSMLDQINTLKEKDA